MTSGYPVELAEIYDGFYASRGKDHSAEAASVIELVRRRGGSAGSLLDVACGTGAHLRRFAQFCPHVEGLELSADMLAVARRTLPNVPLHHGDMRDFSLGSRFDVVTCMFSSIGHLADTAELNAGIGAMAEHLSSGGTLVIEPWWFPDTFLPGYVAGDVVESDGRTIARVSHSTVEGRISRVEVHYVVAGPDGIASFVDVHHITLFTRDEYEAAFRTAGCAVDYLASGPSGRGLFIGTRP